MTPDARPENWLPDSYQHSDGETTWLVLDAGEPGEWLSADVSAIVEVRR